MTFSPTWKSTLTSCRRANGSGGRDTSMGIERRTQYTRERGEGQTLVTLETVRLVDRLRAGVAKLADARDSKSRGLQGPCGFDPHLRHQRPPLPAELEHALGVARALAGGLGH